MRGIAVTTVIVCLAWSAVLALRPNAGYTQTVSNFGLMLVALTAGAQAFRRSRREVGGSARAWRMLGLACLSWGLGQAVWTWYESMLGREVPFPSLADIGYLMFVPLAAGALLVLPECATTSFEPDQDRARRAADRQRAAVHELDVGARPVVRGRR